MAEHVRDFILKNLNQKSTAELIEIWQTNDRIQWMDVAFDVIREILMERLGGELPPQNEPVLKYSHKPERAATNDEDEFMRDESTSRFLVKEKAPVFYRPVEILMLDKWLYRVAIFSIIASILSNFPQLVSIQKLFNSYSTQSEVWKYASWYIASFIFIITVLLQSVVIFFPLKALGSILKILMQMEFNSRVTK